MSEANHPSPGKSGQEAPSLVAVPFLERKLDELFDALREARYSKALLDAKASLQARDYSKALQLVKSTRELCTPASPGDRPRPAGMRAHKGATVDVLAGFAVVLRLLQPLADWHEQQPKAPVEEPSLSPAPSQVSPCAAEEPTEEKLAKETPAGSPDLAKRYSSINLERGVFSQLLSAAQYCGLVANPDVIIAVRDREVPAGRYQKAFEMIEAVYIQFQAQAAQRLSDLRREEMQYKAGTLKMSMKEWLARQRRVTEQNQRVDRARRHFTRVLDGLRVIRLSNSE